MIDLVITAKTHHSEKSPRWFVEWPLGGDVDPSKEVILLDIVYKEMKYVGQVGFCIYYPESRKEPHREASHHVMFVDHMYYYQIKSVDEATFYQRTHTIVGMVFEDQASAELFKHKIEVRWTFKALKKDYV